MPLWFYAPVVAASVLTAPAMQAVEIDRTLQHVYSTPIMASDIRQVKLLKLLPNIEMSDDRILVQLEEPEVGVYLPGKGFTATPLCGGPYVADRERNLCRLGDARRMISANQAAAVVDPADVHNGEIENPKDRGLHHHGPQSALQAHNRSHANTLARGHAIEQRTRFGEVALAARRAAMTVQHVLDMKLSAIAGGPVCHGVFDSASKPSFRN